jgi:O-antigen/teichoic acid export membrane protein
MGIIQRQGLKNALITYTGIVIGYISLIVIQPHFLTREELGLTRVLFSFSAFIATFFPLGIQSITVKYFPLFRNIDKRHNGYFGFMVLFPLIGFLIASSVIYFFKSQIVSQYVEQSFLFTRYFDYVFPFMLILSMIGVLSSYSYAIYKTTVPSFLNDIVVRLMFVGIILLYYFGYFDLNGFIISYLFIYLVQLVLLMIYIAVYDRPGLRIDFSYLKSNDPKAMISFGLLMSLASLASLGLKFLDIIILGKYVSLSMIGIYTVAVFVPTLIEAPYNALDRILAPKVAAAWAQNNVNEIEVIYKKSTRYMFLIGGLLFIGINANISSLMNLLPQDFSQGIIVVNIISIGTIINMATGANDSILMNSSKYIYGTYLMVFLFVLSLTLNFIFIPQYGIVGAALATAISVTVYNILKFSLIYNFFGMQPFEKSSVRVLLSLVLTGLVSFFIPKVGNHYIDIIINASITTAVFLMMIYRMKIVPELLESFKLLRRKRGV